MSSSPLPVRSRLALLLAIAVVATGLLIPSVASPSSATSAAATSSEDIPADCVADPQLCPPPPLLNKQLLTDPTSFFYATPQQQAELSVLEDQAVANVIAGHGLATTEAAAVRSWGRDEALAEMWALVVQAIRTDPGQRTETQKAAVAWMGQIMNRKAREVGLNAGWEFLKWAGRVSATDIRPEPEVIVADLQRFADRTLLPRNFMNGNADNSDSGYCDYVPPTGMEDQYDGNVSKAGNNAGIWCYPPYVCTDPLGCNDRQPSFESFLAFGEARVFGDPSKDLNYALTAKNVSRSLMFAGSAAGAGLVGLGMAAVLGPLAASSALSAALFPFMAVAVETGALIGGTAVAAVDVIAAGQALVAQQLVSGTITAQVAAQSATNAAAATAAIQASAGAQAAVADAAAAAASPAWVSASVGGAIVVVVIAIAILVTRTIEVVQDALVPGRLRDVVTNAMAGTPDLQSMITSSSDVRGLFGLFVRAAGPPPQSFTCDNSTLFTNVVSGVAYNTNWEGSAPCANRTTISQEPGDYQFLIEPTAGRGTTVIGPGTRTDTLTWVDQAIDPPSTPMGDYWTNRATFADGWFIASTTYPNGTVSTPQKLLTLSYKPSNEYSRATTRLVTKDDGSYAFLTTVVAGGLANGPDTCANFRTCYTSDSLYVWQPPEEPGGPLVSVKVTIVPALTSNVSITHSANPVVGAPTTLTAVNNSPELGALSYQWYLKQASGLVVVCPPAHPYCGYEGPFAGPKVDFTWQGSGSFKAILVATDQNGRKTTVEKMVDVGSVGPKLSVSSPSAAWAGYDKTLTGTVIRPGSGDNQTLTVQWGDDTTLVDTYTTSTPPNCSACNPDWNPRSATELDWRAKHTWANAGTYEVVVTVVNDNDQFDRKYVTVTVDKAPQNITFAAVEDRRLDQTPLVVEATGGRSTKGVGVESTTPSVCTVDAATRSRVDGRARASATVHLVGLGQCSVQATHDGDDNYLAATPLVRTFAVTRGQQEILFPEFDPAYVVRDSMPFELSVLGGHSTGALELLSSTPEVCSTSATVQSRGVLSKREVGTTSVTLTGALGTCSITATQAGNALYAAAEPVTRSFDAVTKAPQVLEFPNIADHTYHDGATFVTVVGGESGQPVLLSTTTPAVCMVSNPVHGSDGSRATLTATILLTAAGTCSVTATQDGAGDYQPAASVTRSFTVAKAPQVIDFAAIDDHIVVDEFDIFADGGSSPHAVVLEGTPDVCDVVDEFSVWAGQRHRTLGTVNLLGIGRCTITATQAGTSDHETAEPVQRRFAVKLVLGRLVPELTVTTVPDLQVAREATFAGTIAKGLAGDASTLTIDWGDGITNTKLHDPPLLLACPPCNPTLVLRSPTELDWSATHTWAHAGSYVMTITLENQEQYRDRQTFMVEVGKAQQHLSFDPISDHGLDDVFVGATVKGGPAGTDVVVASTTPDVCTVEGRDPSSVDGQARELALVRLVGAGTCTLRAIQDGDADHLAADPVTTSFDVSRGTQTIHFPHAEGPLPLGTAPFEVSAAGGAASQPVLISSSTSDVCTASESEQTRDGGLTVRQIGTSTISLVGAGQCTLTVTQDGDANYLPAESATWSFDVQPKQAQALAFPTPADATYGDDPIPVSLTGGGSSEPIQLTSDSPDVCVVSTTAPGRDGGVATLTATVGVMGAGDCRLTASQPGDDVYDAAEPVTRGFTVVKAAQALDVDTVDDHTYGDEPFSVTATGGSSVAPVEWATETPGVCSVGNPLETRVGDRSRTTSTVRVLRAGACQIMASQGGTADFAPAEPVTRSFTVGKQAQVLDFPTVDDHVFGDPAFEVSAIGGGSTSPASLTGSTPQVCTLSDVTSNQQSGREQVTATAHLHGAGVCTITAAHSGDDNHLAASEVVRSFAVGRAVQSIAFAPLEQRTYGSPDFTVAATGGASAAPVTLTSTTPTVCTVVAPVNSRVAGLAQTTSTVTMKAAGSCAITADQAGTADYAAATSVVRSFTVAKAALTIAVDDRTMIVGGPVPPLTYHYVGLVGSDTSGVVTGVTCSATDSAGAVVGKSTPVGGYQIACSGAAAESYEITYRPGTLRVRYLFSGMIGYSATTINQVKAGSTVSARWTLKDAAGKYISSRTSFVSLTTTPMTCDGPVPTSGAIAVPGGTSVPKYDTKTGTWTYNWKTAPKLIKTCVALTLNLADGTSSTIRLQFKATGDARPRSRWRREPLPLARRERLAVAMVPALSHLLPSSAPGPAIGRP